MTSSANAQTNAAAPDAECTCPVHPGSPPTIAPKNFQALIDGRQYDISTYRFFRNAEFGQPQKELPSHVEPFFDSGMYRIIPDVEIEVGRGVGYVASIFRSPEPGAEGAAFGFDAEIDRDDDVPPTVGPGLKVRNDFFTNECGSKAIFFEDGGTSDDFSGNAYRLPVLVRIRSTERDLAFTTFSTTYGITSLFVQNVIAYYPFTGWCIGDRGLESTDFELGEAVEFELTVYDYAGNAGEPKVQALEWPIERIPLSAPVVRAATQAKVETAGMADVVSAEAEAEARAEAAEVPAESAETPPQALPPRAVQGVPYEPVPARRPGYYSTYFSRALWC